MTAEGRAAGNAPEDADPEARTTADPADPADPGAHTAADPAENAENTEDGDRAGDPGGDPAYPQSWYQYPTANAAYPLDLAWPAPPPRSRPSARAVAAAVGVFVAVVAAVAALGAPLGLLWAAVAPTVPVRMTSEGALLTGQQPEEFIAGDGWFTLLGAGFGVLVAVIVWLVVRRRGPVPLVAVTLGAVGAGLIAWWVGRHQGLDAYQRMLDSAPDGAVFGKPADLRAADVDVRYGFVPVIRGDVLVPALAAAVTYALLAGWSRFPSLRPEAEPEAGPGAPPDPGAEPGPFSWDSTATPAHPAAPARPAPGEAAPPPG